MNKNKIILLVVLLIVSFAAGRFTAPLSEKTETKTVDNERKSSDSEKDTTKHLHKKTTVVVVTNPDGSKKETSTTTEDDKVEKKSKTESSSSVVKSSDTTKEITRSGSRLSISALAGTKPSFSSFTPDYGAMVCKDLIGPIHIGAFGFSSGFVGVALGVSF